MPKFKHLQGGIGEIRLTADHSLFIGHKPDTVKCEEGICENILSEATEEGMASLGLFGGSSDMNKFYPDISAADWTPKEADFIQPIFRALSETVVMQFGYIPIDFSKGGILKASMKKLVGQTINTNHDTEVENAVGAISKVSWQEKTKVGGTTVPAGINAVFKIDAKSNPRLARNILMDPPAVHSDSVTVRFKHEPSHTFENQDDFWKKLGTKNAKGELIRLIVTEIIAFKEASLVSHGADPYAQVIENDEINDLKYAKSVYSFKDNNSNYKPHKKEDMELEQLLAALGLADSGIVDWDGLTAHLNKAPDAAPEVALYQALIEVDKDLTPETLTVLQENQLEDGAILLGEGDVILTEDDTAVLAKVKELGGVEEVETQVKLGVDYLTTIRSKAVRDYKLTTDAPDDNIMATVMAADLPTAKSFEVSYHAQLEKNVPLTCQSCGSVNISRASTKKEGDDPEKEDSYKESRDRFAKKSRRTASDIHGK